MPTPSNAPSPTAVAESARPVRRNVTHVALWSAQFIVGLFLFFSGIMKLIGAEEAVALFDAIGAGQWFRYVTGLIEAVGAALLVTPSFAPYGALLLAVTMSGAVLTHLFVIGGSAMAPAVLLVVLLGIVWGRRDRIAGPSPR